MSRAGKILHIDLNDGKMSTEATSKYAKDFLGGGGIAAKLFWDNVPPDTKGLDPENMITFNAGPLTGTLFGTKLEVSSKSPQYTNAPLRTCGMGGQFAAEMKFAGYDHITIKGKSDHPVYINIDNDEVEIKSADHLWGLDTQKTQERIREELEDPDVQSACIGPAGENQVVCACVIHDVQNCASWNGLGAVWGSKNLKAVTIRGTKGLKIGNPKEYKRVFDKVWKDYTEGGRWELIVKELHSAGLSDHSDLWYSPRAAIPWGFGAEDQKWEHPEVRPEDTFTYFNEKHLKGKLGCAFCMIQCQENFHVPGVGSGGMACWVYASYRTILKTQNPSTWFKGSRLANLMGIDTVQTTNMIAWLMLIYEKGLITEKDTDGIPMEWGNEEAILSAIEKMSKCEGFGKIFRDGIEPAVQAIANGLGEEYCPYERNTIHPLPIADPGPLPGGLGGGKSATLATSVLYWQPPEDRYAEFPLFNKWNGKTDEENEKMVEGWLTEFCERWGFDRNAWKMSAVKDRAKYIWGSENGVSSADLTGHCDWASDRVPHTGYVWNYPEAAEMVSAATGENITNEQMYDFIQRKRMVEMAYNILAEVLIGDFPEVSEAYTKLFSIDPKDGYFKGRKWNTEGGSEIVGEEYCNIRHLDPDTGVPLRGELERLGLYDVLQELIENELIEPDEDIADENNIDECLAFEKKSA